jgi:hypothetical protein
MATAKLEIRHNAALQRFEATVDGRRAPTIGWTAT